MRVPGLPGSRQARKTPRSPEGAPRTHLSLREDVHSNIWHSWVREGACRHTGTVTAGSRRGSPQAHWDQSLPSIHGCLEQGLSPAGSFSGTSSSCHGQPSGFTESQGKEEVPRTGAVGGMQGRQDTLYPLSLEPWLSEGQHFWDKLCIRLGAGLSFWPCTSVQCLYPG